MSLQSLWKSVSKSKSFRPARFSVPSANVDPAIRFPEPFRRHQQYFEVKVNEMFLAYDREWFTTWQPMVFAGSRFLYMGKMREVPFVVGPQMIEDNSKSLPDGMIFENTKVAGLHPYRGGEFTLHMVLARLQTNNYLKRLISIMESTSGTYLKDFATAVVPYTKVAKIILNSFEDLLGTEEVEPMVGYRFTMNPDTSEGVKPGYFVLINKPEQELDEARFYVIDDRLYYGDDIDTAEPYRGGDYVLYSMLATNHRSDVEILPYYEEFVKLQQSIRDMGVVSDEEKKLLNGKLFALTDTIRMSPDLIREQVEDQIAELRGEVKKMIDDRRPLAGGGPRQQDQRDEWERKMDDELSSILKDEL